MIKILVLAAVLGVSWARPGGHGLGLDYGFAGAGHGVAVAPLAAPVAHTVLAPITVSAGISHVSRVDYPSPVTAVVATGPAVVVGPGLGLGYGLGGHGLGAGHGLLGHGHY